MLITVLYRTFDHKIQIKLGKYLRELGGKLSIQVFFFRGNTSAILNTEYYCKSAFAVRKTISDTPLQ